MTDTIRDDADVVGPAAAGLPVGLASEHWAGDEVEQQVGWDADARYFEYSRAANPVGSGRIPPVPIEQFPAACHEEPGTRVVPLDLSASLGLTDGPATSPALSASFVRIDPGDSLALCPVATSELYYVVRGSGHSIVGDADMPWAAGDFFVLPAGTDATHHANEDTTFYWVTDEPLLRYLGVAPTGPRFRPTRFAADRTEAELQQIIDSPHATDRNRLAVLLNTTPNPLTQTVTHVLWAMYGLLPEGAVQRPHRHQSVALDLIIDCQPGCYSLVGRTIDERGDVVDPVRVDWEAGGAFVTPPGLWHAHVNESGAPARLIPIQDAGLHSYLRTLDIRFAPPAR